MSDECSYVECDIYPPELYRAAMRKARKRHKCDECERDISRGESYEHVEGIWEGRWGQFRTCMDCLSIRQVFFPEGYNHGGVLTELFEHLASCDVTEKQLTALTPTAREWVLERGHCE